MYTTFMNESHLPRLQQELHQSRPFATAAQEASISVLRTADHVRRHLSQTVEQAGITLQQYNVLRVLRGVHPEPLPTLEIGERLIERTPGITRLLDRLEAKELIRRQRSSTDRRLVECSITPQGLALIAGLDDAVDRADESAVQGLTVSEQQDLVRLLAAIRRHL